MTWRVPVPVGVASELQPEVASNVAVIVALVFDVLIAAVGTWAWAIRGA